MALAVAVFDCPALYIPLLAGHPDGSVRRLVASRGDCPPGLLADLAQDSDRLVAIAALQNFCCPRYVRDRAAASSGNPYVSGTAWWLLADPMPLLSPGPSDQERRIVKSLYVVHPRCPSDVLGELSGDSDQTFRVKVAAHPGCPPVVMRRLAADPVWQVRLRLASNPSCPPDLLGGLGHDGNRTVRYLARKVLKAKVLVAP